MSAGPLPEGYRTVELGGGIDALVWDAAERWLVDALSEGATLHTWASRHAMESLPGRGPVHVIAAGARGPDGSARWAVRHYRRGGGMAPLLGDWYWRAGGSRPRRELEASARARARGVPTPAVVAGATYHSGWSRAAGFYRADLVTEAVPRATSLAALLAGTSPADGSAPAQDATSIAGVLRLAGRLVSTLARAGVLHPDLSAGNVLVDDAGEAWVVDLDRARADLPDASRAGTTMLARLERSVRKIAAAAGSPLPHDAWAALRAGFEDGS